MGPNDFRIGDTWVNSVYTNIRVENIRYASKLDGYGNKIIKQLMLSGITWDNTIYGYCPKWVANAINTNKYTNFKRAKHEPTYELW